MPGRGSYKVIYMTWNIIPLRQILAQIVAQYGQKNLENKFQ